MVKVNKRQARNLYNHGKKVYLLPCKVRIDNIWIQPYMIFKESDYGSFEYLVDFYEYYNCCNELGIYSAYYIEEQEVK